MMETKLWIALCAILVIHLGSATPDNNHTNTPPSKNDPVQEHSSPGPGSSASITIIPEPGKNNVTTGATTKNENIAPLSQSHSTTPVPTHTGTTNITKTTPFLKALVTPTPSSNPNVSQPQNSAEQRSQGTALPTTSTPATTITTNKSTTNKSSTSSTSSSQNSTTSQLTTKTSQSSRQSNTTQPNNHTKPHTNPLPLNAEDITTGRASLDPLLAGLVSAFIIAAVIITLLLFLKLRRRGNRPEFRRLQELPMDDMEDAPLSMYSY